MACGAYIILDRRGQTNLNMAAIRNEPSEISEGLKAWGLGGVLDQISSESFTVNFPAQPIVARFSP